MRGRLSERRLSRRGIRNLGQRAREILADARKKEATQTHFQDSKWWMWNGPPAPAASGAPCARRRELNWELPTYANPCPKTREWYHGLQHKNALRENAGKLWEPVRATASYKQSCLKKLEGLLKEGGLVFSEAYPDTRETGGVRALTEAGWNGLEAAFGIKTELGFV